MSELPNGWASVEMRELASIKLGKMLDKTKNKGEPQPYLRNINVRWGEFDLSDLYSMRFTDDELPTFEIRDGDLIVCEGGEPGRCAVWNNGPTELKYQKALLRARFENGVNPCLVALYMRLLADNGQLQDHFTGTTIKHLPHAAFEKIKVPLPPQQEQRRIVAKLDSLRTRSSRAREELDHIPKLIERYKQAILAKAFSGELTRDWRDEHELPDWEDTTIGEIGEVMLGRQRSPANHDGPQMRPYVRAANITWNGWDLSDLKLMNFDDRDFSRFQLKSGDVLINEGSGSAKEVGKPAIWRGAIENCCFQNTLIKVRPVRCTSEFLHRYIYWCARSEQFVSSTQGVNIYHIGKEGLARFPILLPHPDEQSEIVRRVDVALEWLEKIATEHARAEHLLPKLDQAILAKAFRGELVPQDPNDEPASVLLERIRAENEKHPKARRNRR